MKLLPAFTGQPEVNRIYHTEFFTLCGAMGDNSVDMILCDLPYGTTACSWDNRIPLEPMWEQFKRIIKPNGAIVLTASQPFTSMLNTSNFELFKYSWIWIKNRPSDKFNAKNKPMDCYEDISVFSLGATANGAVNKMNYYPQGLIRSGKTVRGMTGIFHHGTRPSHKEKYTLEWTNYPKNVLYFPKDDNTTVHPTQKPVALFEYLIRTYTLPDRLVFDPCVGSGTTAVAAKNTGRNYICGDMMLEYVELARKRVNPVFGEPPKRKREVLPMTSLPLFEAISQ